MSDDLFVGKIEGVLHVERTRNQVRRTRRSIFA
jgi:hypothetical protein